MMGFLASITKREVISSIELVRVCRMTMQNHAFEGAGGTVAEILARFERAEADGTRALSEWGSIYYHVYGDSAQDYRNHTVVAVPYATRDLGFPIARGPALLWLMEAGTSGTHLMVSGR